MTARYHIAALLSKGPFGKIYRAVREDERGTERDVAVKLLSDDDVSALGLPHMREAARRLATIEDRAVVAVRPPVRIGTAPNQAQWALVADLVTGVALQRLKALGAMPPLVAAEIVREVARVLDLVWNTRGPDGRPLQILHSDIKPSNLQLNVAGELRILDFGVAKADYQTRAAQTMAFATSNRGYIAPERLDGIDTPAGDVFSLGVTAHVLMGGQPDDEALNVVADTAAEQAVLALVARMRDASAQRRPTAAELVGLCDRILKRSGDNPLEEWAEENVMRAIAVRFSDEVVGTTLLEYPDPDAVRASAAPTGRRAEPVSKAPVSKGPVSTPPTQDRTPATRPRTAPPAPPPPAPRRSSVPPADLRRAVSVPPSDRQADEAATEVQRRDSLAAPQGGRREKVAIPRRAPSVPPRGARSVSFPKPEDDDPATVRGTGPLTQDFLRPPPDEADDDPVTVQRKAPPLAGRLARSFGKEKADDPPTVQRFGPPSVAPDGFRPSGPAPLGLVPPPKAAGGDAQTVVSNRRDYLPVGTPAPEAPVPPGPASLAPRSTGVRWTRWMAAAIAMGMGGMAALFMLGIVVGVGAWWLTVPPVPPEMAIVDNTPPPPLEGDDAPLTPPLDRAERGLTFSSVPLGADVFVDRRRVGRTPLLGLTLADGAHEVVIVSDAGWLLREIEVGKKLPMRYVWRGGELWEAHK